MNISVPITIMWLISLPLPPSSFSFQKMPWELEFSLFDVFSSFTVKDISGYNLLGFGGL